jgi:hypothetical protein
MPKCHFQWRSQTSRARPIIKQEIAFGLLGTSSLKQGACDIVTEAGTQGQEEAGHCYTMVDNG